MSDRPRFFDDLAGVAGGAFSAFAGMRDEIESLLRTRLDEVLRRMDLVRREEFEAVSELAANARAAQEAADSRLDALAARIADLERAAAAPPSPALPPATPAPGPGTPL